MNLQGTFTAMITPFSDGNVDYKKIKSLVDMQIEGNIDGLLPMGTTGESPTLSTTEHLKVIETVVQANAGRAVVMAGTGANSTAEAIELTEKAKQLGVDVSLQVTPYYNKPTQKGLYKHFLAIAEEVNLPMVLYNVPGRSGVPIAIDTIVKLSEHPNIIAVKEAGGSADRVSQILNKCDIQVFCGDDSLTLPMMSIGAKGVISVASNIIPAEISRMVNAFTANDLKLAQELHYKYYSFFNDIFIETNPIPIKAAMAMKGIIEEEYRLPLCTMSNENREILKETMRKIGILQ